MPIFQTPLYTSQVPAAGASEAVNYPLAKNARGKLRIVQALYVLLGTEVANDLIYLTLAQPADRVIPSLCTLVFENPGTTLTLSVGDSVTANRYCGTLTLSNTVGSLDFDTSPVAGTYVLSDIALPPYNVANPPQPVPPPNTTDQTIIIAKVLTAAALTAGKRLLFLIALVGE